MSQQRDPVGSAFSQNVASPLRDQRASSDELRDQADTIEGEFSPVLIARFDC